MSDNPAPPPLLPDIMARGLKVVFVGAAASLWSAEAGHYYAGPNNRFWPLLHQAGFTPRQFRPQEDSEALQYGIGLTGLFKNLASGANHLLPAPSREHRQRLMEKLESAAPQWVCFNGKDVYALAMGRPCLEWGEQSDVIGESRVFTVISSSARADKWAQERLALYKELRERTLSSEGVA